MKKSLVFLGLLICTLTNYAQQAGTYKDPRDGKVYKTVKIGTQTWFAENLNYATSTNSWCYENNSNKCQVYGRYYHYEIAKSVCPNGWHLPNEVDLMDLFNFLGGTENINTIGGKLKSKEMWYSPNTGVTNEVSFNAQPTGISFSKNDYYETTEFGKYSIFWINSLKGTMQFALSYDNAAAEIIIKENDENFIGGNVRCIKN